VKDKGIFFKSTYDDINANITVEISIIISPEFFANLFDFKNKREMMIPKQINRHAAENKYMSACCDITISILRPQFHFLLFA